jgi:phosphoribosyl 1,2-cyclic phosphodiesterase
VVVTHEHGDHARGAVALAGHARVPLYASGGTLGRLGADGRTLAHLETVGIGPFTVTACRTPHDAAEPVALAVVGPDGAKLGLAHDLGSASGVVRYLLRGADCLLVEANHDDEMLRQAPYPGSVRQRIGGALGHLSNRAAARLLAEVCHPGLATVVLAHVSEQCNRPELALEAVRAGLSLRGFGGALLAACQDVPLGPLAVEVGAAA